MDRIRRRFQGDGQCSGGLWSWCQAVQRVCYCHDTHPESETFARHSFTDLFDIHGDGGERIWLLVVLNNYLSAMDSGLITTQQYRTNSHCSRRLAPVRTQLLPCKRSRIHRTHHTRDTLTLPPNSCPATPIPLPVTAQTSLPSEVLSDLSDTRLSSIL